MLEENLKLKKKALADIVRHKCDTDDPSHDFAHIMRVTQTCEELGEKLNADLEHLIPAALLHDLINLPKDHPQRSEASELSASASVPILEELKYNHASIVKIQTIITEHSFSRGEKASCIESAILQDADRLDALGAVGIMRLVACGTRLGSRLFHTDDPFATHRDLDEKAYMIDHMYAKLLKLPETFNTNVARAMAEKRARFLQVFLEELGFEIAVDHVLPR